MNYSDYMAMQNKKRKPKKHEESEIQIALVQWFRVNYPNVILTISMAGVNLPIQTAVRLKRMGYLPATPDIMIFRARKGYNGLFIELKTKDGKLSAGQKEMSLKLQEEGYKAVVAYGIDEAKGIINDYLELKNKCQSI